MPLNIYVVGVTVRIVVLVPYELGIHLRSQTYPACSTSMTILTFKRIPSECQLGSVAVQQGLSSSHVYLQKHSVDPRKRDNKCRKVHYFGGLGSNLDLTIAVSGERYIIVYAQGCSRVYPQQNAKAFSYEYCLWACLCTGACPHVRQ